MMDRSGLARWMELEGIRADAVSLFGGTPNEAYVIDGERGGRWVVYYSQRGLKTGATTFDSEIEAVEHLRQLLVRDSSTRRRA